MWEAQDKLVAFSKLIMLATYFVEATSCLQYICHLIIGSSTAHSRRCSYKWFVSIRHEEQDLSATTAVTSSTTVAESDTDKMK